MNKGKVKIALVAIVLGITGAIATKPATANPLDVTWSRKGTTLNPSGGNEWVQGSGSGSCLTATRICTATFATGYDPNSHSYSDNQTAATSVVVNNGYQP